MAHSFSGWINSKTKKNLQQADYIPLFLKDLQEYAAKFEIVGNTILTLQRVETLGLDEGSPTFNDEAFLERLFLRVHADWYNHFSFNGNNSIDLVRATEKGYITDLIELKKGSNNLYHALYEVIFYYFLLCRAKNEIKNTEKPTFRVADTLNLIVILPQQLYNQPDRYNKSKEAFVATLQTELEKRVSASAPKPTLHVVKIPANHPFLCHSQAELIQAYKGENPALYNDLLNATNAIQLP